VSGTTSYTAVVSNNITSITITVVCVSPQSTFKINGVSNANNVPSQAISLNVGSNNIVMVNVTSGNGLVTQTYIVNVTRLEICEKFYIV